VVVVKLAVWLAANEHLSRSMAIAIVRPSTAIERPSSPMATAIVGLSMVAAVRRSSSSANARSGSSSCDAIEQPAMWMMMRKTNMKKTRKMMWMMMKTRMRVEDAGEAVGEAAAEAVARFANERAPPLNSSYHRH
jgi:hypothetical protein